jgi:hypothetical protein
LVYRLCPKVVFYQIKCLWRRFYLL